MVDRAHSNKKNKYKSQQIRQSITDRRITNGLHDKSYYDQYQSDTKLIESYTSRNELRILSNVTRDDFKYNAKHDKHVLREMRLKDMHEYCGICPPDYKFHHKPSELLSLPTDAFLKSRLLIKYWDNRNATFDGVLTCISHSGFIRVQDFLYDDYKCDILNEYELPRNVKFAYWFHYKCITEIWKWNEDDQEYNIDFKPMIFDLLKIKIIQEMEGKMWEEFGRINDFMEDVIGDMDEEDIVNIMDVWNNESASNMVNGYFNDKYEVDDKGKQVIKWKKPKRMKKKQWKMTNGQYEVFFILFLKYKNLGQVKEIRFTKNEIADILAKYIDIARSDDKLKDILDEIEQEKIKKAKIREKMSSNFMNWDDSEIEYVSKQRIKRTM